MRISLKYGVSAVALLAAMSLAQAQTGERQSEKPGGAAQHSQGERAGKEGGAVSHQGTREQGTQGQRGTTAQREHTPSGSAQREGSEGSRSAKSGGQSEERAGEAQRNKTGAAGRAEEQGNQGEQPKERRTAKSQPGSNETGKESERANEQNERKGERTGTQQRQTNIGGAGKSENLGRESERVGGKRASFHVSAAQRTELHSRIFRDSAIRRYHRGDVNFSANVGARIPASVEYYDPPAYFVDVDPEFRGYKIVVLDDVILIVDPETREIVDVIPA
jgi:Protein of unknown function (DUF1236)